MASAAITRQYGSPAEASAYSGVSARTIRRLYKSGRLPHHRIGRRVVIAFPDLDAAIRSNVLALAPAPAGGASAVDESGRALPLTAGEARARSGRILEALGEAGDGGGFDQVDELAQLQAGLAAARGGP